MIGIVIVNYNGEKFQNDSISSLLNSTYSDFKIIVVDNGSNDNSMVLLDNFNDDRIIKLFNKENLGVAAGNNIGIKKSLELKTDYTLLINNDVECDKDMLERLINMNKEVVSPIIYYHNTKKIWYCGGKINKFKGIVSHFYYRQSNFKIKKVCEYAPTCCLLIKNNVFEKTGLFDEKYFLYYDDVDFCYKFHKNKIKINMCKDAIMYHKVSMSSGGEQSKTSIYYNNRNRFYFISKLNYFYKPFAFTYSFLTRKLKMKKNEVIKKAYTDYKNNNMGRCDDL